MLSIPMEHVHREFSHRELRAVIVRYCAASPSAQHNGIACVNRIWNVAWRGMKRELVRTLFMVVRENLMSLTSVHVVDCILNLSDLEDVA